jgi:hypothetical protein
MPIHGGGQQRLCVNRMRRWISRVPRMACDAHARRDRQAKPGERQAYKRDSFAQGHWWLRRRGYQGASVQLIGSSVAVFVEQGLLTVVIPTPVPSRRGWSQGRAQFAEGFGSCNSRHQHKNARSQYDDQRRHCESLPERLGQHPVIVAWITRNPLANRLVEKCDGT